MADDGEGVIANDALRCGDDTLDDQDNGYANMGMCHSRTHICERKWSDPNDWSGVMSSWGTRALDSYD